MLLFYTWRNSVNAVRGIKKCCETRVLGLVYDFIMRMIYCVWTSSARCYSHFVALVFEVVEIGRGGRGRNDMLAVFIRFWHGHFNSARLTYGREEGFRSWRWCGIEVSLLTWSKEHRCRRSEWQLLRLLDFVLKVNRVALNASWCKRQHNVSGAGSVNTHWSVDWYWSDN